MADYQHGVRGPSWVFHYFFVGVRQQNGCFDTHTFTQFSTYGQGKQGLSNQLQLGLF